MQQERLLKTGETIFITVSSFHINKIRICCVNNYVEKQDKYL